MRGELVMDTSARVRIIFFLIIALVVIRGVLYEIIIPFDRAPDEREHFRRIKAQQLALNRASEAEKRRAAAEFERVFYALIHPTSSKQRSIDDFPDAFFPAPQTSRSLYYWVTAWMLKLLSLENIRTEIYVIRSFSILCGLGVIVVAFFVTRELFPDQSFMLIGVPAFIMLIPQFSAMNGVINNDKLAEVFSALSFLIVVKILKSGMKIHFLSAYFLLICLTYFSKRTGIFLFPFFMVFLFVYVWKSGLGVKTHLVLLGGSVGFILLVYGLLWFPPFYFWFDEHLLDLPPVNQIHYLVLRPEMWSTTSLKYYAKFLTVMYWSFWGVFGYMTIHLHHFWYMAAAGVQGLAIGGLVRSAWRSKKQQFRMERWKTKVLYVFGVSILLVVSLPFLRSVIFRPGDPRLTQGRYLFTVIVPIAVLTVFGLMNLFPPKYHRLVGGLCLAGLFMLDTVSLLGYIALNFHNITLF